jgi:hypothetical protein
MDDILKKPDCEYRSSQESRYSIAEAPLAGDFTADDAIK